MNSGTMDRAAQHGHLLAVDAVERSPSLAPESAAALCSTGDATKAPEFPVPCMTQFLRHLSMTDEPVGQSQSGENPCG